MNESFDKSYCVNFNMNLRKKKAMLFFLTFRVSEFAFESRHEFVNLNKNIYLLQFLQPRHLNVYV